MSATETRQAQRLEGTSTLRPLIGVLTATAVSATGTRISAIAVPWFVLSTTGSATDTGLAAFWEMAPYVLVKAFAGPIIDVIGPRLASWTTDIASALIVGLLPLLFALRALPFPLLLLLVALAGALRGPGDLAKGVMVPEAADLARMPLPRATGIQGAADQLSNTLGPALGGALVAAFGPMNGVVIDAATFAAGSVIIGLTLPRGVGRSTITHTAEAPGDADADRQTPSRYLHHLAEGWRFLRSEKLLLSIAIMVAVTNLVSAGSVSVLLPVWAKHSGHGTGAIGLVEGVLGVAAICASIIAAAVAHRLPRRPVYFVGYLLTVPMYLILAAPVPLWLCAVVFAISGLGGGFINPIIGALIFERIPRPMLGRVEAMIGSLAWAGIPLGGLIAGAAVAAAGLAPALLTGGTICFLAITLTGLRPEWRDMSPTPLTTAPEQQ